jgi:tellurite resistance protein TehA-like permease
LLIDNVRFALGFIRGLSLLLYFFARFLRNFPGWFLLPVATGIVAKFLKRTFRGSLPRGS